MASDSLAWILELSMDTEEQHFGGDFTLLVFFINVSKLSKKLSLGQHGAGLRPAGQSHRHDAGGGLETGWRSNRRRKDKFHNTA